MFKKISITFTFSFLILGVSFLNQILISDRFGTSSQLDEYWFALSVAGVLTFYVHPLRDSAIPIFSGLLPNRNKAFEYAGSTISLAFFLGLLGWGLIGCFYFIVPLFSVLEGIRKINSLVYMLCWLGPSMALLAASELLVGLLTALNLVIPQAFCRTFTPVASCIALIFFGELLGIYALPAAALFANGLTILVVLFFLKKEGVAFKFHNPLKVINVKNNNLFTSLTIIYMIAQLNTFIERFIFSRASEGTISSYQYALALVSTLIGLISGPIAAALWPKFLELTALDDKGAIWKILDALLIFMILPLAFICIFLFKNSSAIIYIVFSRGGFTEQSLLMTALAFCLLIFTAIPSCMHQIIGRLLNSQRNSRSILLSSLAISSSSIAILVFGEVIGNYKISMTHWFISTLVGAVLSFYFVYQSIGSARESLASHYKIYIKVALIMGISFLICPVVSLETSKFILLSKISISFLVYFLLCMIIYMCLFRLPIKIGILSNIKKLFSNKIY